MTRKRDPEQLEDGEEWEIPAGHFTHECCDCGLVHQGTIYRRVKGKALKTVKGALVLRLWRDEGLTKEARKGQS